MFKAWSIITSWRARLRPIARQVRGFSAIEILLAATVFGVLVTALSGAIIYGRSSTAISGDRAQALALAEEGCEAVRNIRDAAWANVPGTGPYYLGQSGGTWTIASSPAEPAIGIFTRQINVAVLDTNNKQIMCVVNWTTNGVNRSVTITTRISNWAASITPPVTPGPIMMAYSDGTTVPLYRIWDGSAWGAASSALAAGNNVQYVVLKSARTRNEAILGTQDLSGGIWIQVWNGSSWGNRQQVGTGPTNTRSFDIAYEKNSDRAVIAFTPSSGAIDFSYRTWNGTLSSATSITAPPTTGAINWIELRQNPLSASNDIAMIMLDANSDVYGMLWNGSSNTWGTMGTAAVWDASAASAAKKTIDVEYEQTSGEALFLWGDSVATDQYYRTWNGTTLSAATLLDIAAEGGVAEWVQLTARPSSNEIMLGVQDFGLDTNTRVWSGSAWDTATQHPEHDATGENNTSRNFDIIWETHASNLGEAWIMWGDGATITKRQWTSGAPTPWGAATVLTGSDDTSFIRLRADPVSGAVFAGIYESAASAADDIWESRLTGGSATWTAKNLLNTGPTSAEPAYFKIDIATP